MSERMVTHSSSGMGKRDTGYLEINLQALKQNYLALQHFTGSAECAAVVKADAYGIGVAKASQIFYEAGCRTFFIATLKEGIVLRKLLPDCVIYSLNGLQPGTVQDFLDHDLRPVLGSLEELAEWIESQKTFPQAAPAAIHFDTGMNRLGLVAKETEALFSNIPKYLGEWRPSLIMSHLACADEPHHPLNALQLQRFLDIRAGLPGVPASLSNSAGLFLGKEYHFDLVRPGIFLYGSCLIADKREEQAYLQPEPVVTLLAKILKIKTVQPGETIGYSAGARVENPTYIATIAAGYADGIHRRTGKGDKQFEVVVHGQKCPVVGRVSMDLITVDISGIDPQEIRAGESVEIIGKSILLDDVAHMADTISYEILTSLGKRYHRVYHAQSA